MMLLLAAHDSTWPRYSVWAAVLVGEMALMVLAALRTKPWIKRAHRWARHSDIELPSYLEGRIERRLRKERLAFLAVWPFFIAALMGLFLGPVSRSMSMWTTWFPLLLLLVPIVMVLYSFESIVVARWNTAGPTRVSHFRQIRLREAFTQLEVVTLGAGVAMTAGASAWGLWKVHAGLRWWLCDLVTILIAMMLAWRMEVAILDRPSAASNAIELSWDDNLRFLRIRKSAVGAALLPPLLIVYLDFYLDFYLGQVMTRFQHGSMLLPAIIIIAGVGVTMIFRQGRQLWSLDRESRDLESATA